jgi:cbb3-type cytochrome oxidase subunit 1
MNGCVVAWKSARILRWAFWLSTIGYSLYFVSDRGPHLNQFGHLNHITEFLMFGLPAAAVIAGFLELMFRERVTGSPEGLKP